MQLGGYPLVIDSHLGTEIDEFIERLTARRPQIGRRDHPNPPTSVDESAQLFAEAFNALITDEGADEVHLVCASKLLLENRAQRGLPGTVDHQLTGGQWDRGVGWQCRICQSGRAANAAENSY